MMVPATEDPINSLRSIVTDVLVGATAISTPLWLQYTEIAMQALVILGGVVLIALRIALAFRDWRKGNDPPRNSISDE